MNFFLLILEVSFNFIPEIIYKRSRFSKALSEKDFKFVLSKKSGFITYNPGFILLLVEVEFILEKWDYKKDVFIPFNFSGFEIVFASSTEVVTFYLQVFQL